MPEITHFDVAVHFDYSNSPDGITNEDPIELEVRMRACLERVRSNALSEEYALFYFSSYLEGEFPFENLRPAPNITNQEAFESDQQRIREYSRILGRRFILFPGDYEPDWQDIDCLLEEREIVYDFETATLAAYGEYRWACVGAWRKSTTRALGLNLDHTTLIPELSLE